MALQQKPFSWLLLFQLLKRALQKLLHNDPLRMAGATAFFTTFALPFILFIVSTVLGLFADVTKVRHSLFQTLSGVLGADAVRQVVTVLRAFRQLAQNPFVSAAGVVFLFLVSTTLLMVIKASMNQLWRIKVVHGRSVAQTLKTRLQSVFIIFATALLFFFSTVAEGVKAYLGHTIVHLAPAVGQYLVGTLGYLLSLLFVTLWFAVIFRLLPDARAPWRVALTGAFVTSILFNLGKAVLRMLLVSRNLDTLYGTSANVVLLLLFVFYSSLILYYGVAFTRIWAEHKQVSIRPLPYATRYTLMDVKEDDAG